MNVLNHLLLKFLGEINKLKKKKDQMGRIKIKQTKQSNKKGNNIFKKREKKKKRKQQHQQHQKTITNKQVN